MKDRKKNIINIIFILLFLLIIFHVFNKKILYWAVTSNNVNIVEMYAFFKYDFNKGIDREGYSPLFYANSKEMALLLINSGSNINKRVNKGTPLISAIKHKNYNIMKILLDNMADVDISSYGKRYEDSIYISIVVDDPEALSLLLDYCNVINKQKMVVYIYTLCNNDKYDNWLNNSILLLSTMMPNEQKEFLLTMMKNKLISKEKYQKILIKLSNPVIITKQELFHNE